MATKKKQPAKKKPEPAEEEPKPTPVSVGRIVIVRPSQAVPKHEFAAIVTALVDGDPDERVHLCAFPPGGMPALFLNVPREDAEVEEVEGVPTAEARWRWPERV